MTESEDPSGANPLISFLLGVQSECGGIIPFERLMREALYHPRFGYYSANLKGIGRPGDFSTSTTLGEGLGRAIAAWITARAREQSWRIIPIIEVGAGNGSLARSILRNLGWKTRWRIRYTIVETSGILKHQQQSILPARRVAWKESVNDALDAARGRALILSNELVDAFPCRRFEKTVAGWEELGVFLAADGSLTEKTMGPLREEAWQRAFPHVVTGGRIELHDSYRTWLGTWASLWKEGALLTVDYGDLGDKLHRTGRGGTLRAYWKHTRFTGRDLYARFGKQDITADVNFSDLMDWGRDLGWKNRSFETQESFIRKWSKKESLLPSKDSTGTVDAFFRVLEQSPNHWSGEDVPVRGL